MGSYAYISGEVELDRAKLPLLRQAILDHATGTGVALPADADTLFVSDLVREVDLGWELEDDPTFGPPTVGPRDSSEVRAATVEDVMRLFAVAALPCEVWVEWGDTADHSVYVFDGAGGVSEVQTELRMMPETAKPLPPLGVVPPIVTDEGATYRYEALSGSQGYSVALGDRRERVALLWAGASVPSRTGPLVLVRGDPQQPDSVDPIVVSLIHASRWSNGYAVGWQLDGAEDHRYVYLNPSGGSDDGSTTVFVYRGSTGDPAVDEPLMHVELFGGGESGVPA